MKRFLLTFSAIAAVVALAPASALAHKGHHAKRHHKTHHAKAHRVRFERFGRAGSDSSTSGAGGSDSSGTAGTIESFDSGTDQLTILLNDGKTTVSGLVTNQTRLSCSSSASSSSQGQGDDDRDDNDQGEDQSGPGDSGSSWQGDHESSGQQGGDERGDDDQGESAQSCDTSNLKHGAVVQEAELRISSGNATWEKVRLAS